MSTGGSPNSGSSTRSRPSSVTSPTTANGQRSRSHSAPNAGNCRGAIDQYVALLRLVAPDLERRHAGLVARDRCADRCARPCRRARPTPARRSTSPPAPTSWIEQDRVVLAHAPSRRRSPPGAALHLGVAALHGREIEIRRCLRPRPSEDAAPPPSPISSAGPPSTTMRRAGRDGRLLDVAPADVAEAARDHDRLVIAAHRRSALRPVRAARSVRK